MYGLVRARVPDEADEIAFMSPQYYLVGEAFAVAYGDGFEAQHLHEIEKGEIVLDAVFAEDRQAARHRGHSGEQRADPVDRVQLSGQVTDNDQLMCPAALREQGIGRRIGPLQPLIDDVDDEGDAPVLAATTRYSETWPLGTNSLVPLSR